MAYLKPQSPLQHKDGDYFYPLTTVDQVIMEDGSRLNSVFKHTVRINITLLASNWSSTAPYTQTIALDDYIDNLKVDANIVYGGIEETDLELNKAASCLSYIKKNGKNVIFYCLSSKPEIDIPVEIAYESVNSIATVGTSEKIDLNEELAEQAELIGELQTTLQSKMSGNNLNFEIVGGLEQPTNPKENMIWVQTDDKENIIIEHWSFGVEEPEELIDSMVWFYTGTSSAVAFNVLTRNEIQIYPFAVKQYTNGTWVEKTAMTYQNGEWMSWGDYAIQDGIAKYAFMTMTWKQYKATITQNEDSYLITSTGTDPAGCIVLYADEYKGISLANTSKVVLDVADITGSPTVKIKVWAGNTLPSSGIYLSYVEGELAAEALVAIGHNELNLTGLSEGTYTVGIYIQTATELTIQNFGLQ